MTDHGTTATELTEAPGLRATTFLGVATKFLEAVNAFNRKGLTEAQAIKQIEGLLDENVKLYKVTSGHPISGRDEVMKYLTLVLDQQPILAPVTLSFHPPGLPTSVRGEAQWKRKGELTTISIRYKFDFQPEPPYKIVSLWGTSG